MNTKPLKKSEDTAPKPKKRIRASHLAEIAENPDINPDLLHKLAEHKNEVVRRTVAENPSTHPDTLHKLVGDSDPDVRYAVADNQNTHHSTLDALSNDEHSLIRGIVAFHSKTRPETLHKLSNDNDVFVLRSLARNPNLKLESFPNVYQNLNSYKPSNTKMGIEKEKALSDLVMHDNIDANFLHHLASDPSNHIKRMVAYSKKAHPDTLDLLVNNREVSNAVAGNTNTRPETLLKLGKDSDKWLSQKALQNPSHPKNQIKSKIKNKIKKSQYLDKATLEHYSTQQNLKTINPKFKGMGVDVRTKGRDTEHPHSFFYRGGTLPEDVVASGAKSKYIVNIPDEAPLYDLATDNEGHIASAIKQNQGALNMDMVHQRLKDAGYQGFYNSAHPQLSNVVALYHEQPVSEEHELGKSYGYTKKGWYDLSHQKKKDIVSAQEREKNFVGPKITPEVASKLAFDSMMEHKNKMKAKQAVKKQEGTDCDDRLDPLKKPKLNTFCTCEED